MNYGITITDLPDKIDPVILLDEKMRTCPFCKRVVCEFIDGKGYILGDYVRREHAYLDTNGKEHRFRKSLNKYWWNKFGCVRCGKCRAEWKTDFFPADHEMFTVKVNGKGENRGSIMYE